MARSKPLAEFSHLMWRFIRLLPVVLLTAVPIGHGGHRLPHRIQDGSADMCWSPDFEWPVPCDDDE